jgi:hypothetical protein
VIEEIQFNPLINVLDNSWKANYRQEQKWKTQ